jgi:hypothetical protein
MFTKETFISANDALTIIGDGGAQKHKQFIFNVIK